MGVVYISCWVVSLAVIVFLIALITELKRLRTIAAYLLSISFILGYLLYFVGYSAWQPNGLSLSNLPQALSHSLFSTIRMFLANDDISSYVKEENIPQIYRNIIISIWWLIHDIAAISVFLIVISSFGTKLVHQIRLFMHTKERIVIFGVCEQSLCFAETAVNIHKVKKGIIFVDDVIDEKSMLRIHQMGAIAIEDTLVIQEQTSSDGNANLFNYLDKRIIKRIGLRKERFKDLPILKNAIAAKKIEIFLFYPDERKGVFVHSQLSRIIQSYDYSPNRVSVFLQIQDRTYEKLVSETSSKKGEIYPVSFFAETKLAADHLARNFPILSCRNDFIISGLICKEYIDHHKMLIVGFGAVGKEVLKSMLHIGQISTLDDNQGKIVPATFRVDVVDMDAAVQKEIFFSECPALRNNEVLLELKEINQHYLHPEFREHFKENENEYDYIVICLGDDAQNVTAAKTISGWMDENRYSIRKAKIYVNAKETLTKDIEIQDFEFFGSFIDIYDYDWLTNKRLLQEAVKVNEEYNWSSDLRLKWAKLPFFKRASNMAQKLYWEQNYINMNLFKQKIDEPAYNPFSKVLPPVVEVLAMNEHIRWNMFHYINGWRTLTEEYRHFYDKEGKKVSQDSDKRLHACLVDWYELVKIGDYYNTNYYNFDYTFAIMQCIENQLDRSEIKMDIFKQSDSWVYNSDMDNYCGEILMDKNSKMDQRLISLVKEWVGEQSVPRKVIAEKATFQNEEEIETEKLAECVHNAWMKNMKAMGWKYGKKKSERNKTSPLMIAYSKLSEEDKNKDRVTVKAVLDYQNRNKKNNPAQ